MIEQSGGTMVHDGAEATPTPEVSPPDWLRTSMDAALATLKHDLPEEQLNALTTEKRQEKRDLSYTPDAAEQRVARQRIAVGELNQSLTSMDRVAEAIRHFEKTSGPGDSNEGFVQGVIMARAQLLELQNNLDQDLAESVGATVPLVLSHESPNGTNGSKNGSVHEEPNGNAPQEGPFRNLSRKDRAIVLGRVRTKPPERSVIVPLAASPTEDTSSHNTSTEATNGNSREPLPPREPLLKTIARVGNAERGDDYATGEAAKPTPDNESDMTPASVAEYAYTPFPTEDAKGTTLGESEEITPFGTSSLHLMPEESTELSQKAQDAWKPAQEAYANGSTRFDNGTTPFPAEPDKASEEGNSTLDEHTKDAWKWGSMSADSSKNGPSDGSRTPAITSIEVKPLSSIDPADASGDAAGKDSEESFAYPKGGYMKQIHEVLGSQGEKPSRQREEVKKIWSDLPKNYGTELQRGKKESVVPTPVAVEPFDSRGGDWKGKAKHTALALGGTALGVAVVAGLHGDVLAPGDTRVIEGYATPGNEEVLPTPVPVADVINEAKRDGPRIVDETQSFSSIIFCDIGGEKHPDFKILDTNPEMSASLIEINIPLMLKDPTFMSAFPGQTQGSLEQIVREAFTGDPKARDLVTKMTDEIRAGHARYIPSLDELKVITKGLHEKYNSMESVYRIQTDEEIRAAQEAKATESSEPVVTSFESHASVNNLSDKFNDQGVNAALAAAAAAGAGAVASRPFEGQSLFGKAASWLGKRRNPRP